MPARLETGLDVDLFVLRLFVHAEDGSDGHEAVDVGGAVQRVEGDDVVAPALRLDLDVGVVLLGHEQAAGVRRGQHVDEEVVGEHVQLLDRLALDVDRAVGPEQLGDAGPADGGRNGFDGRLDGGQQLGEVAVGRGVLLLLGHQPPGHGHAVRVDGLLVRGHFGPSASSASASYDTNETKRNEMKRTDRVDQVSLPALLQAAAGSSGRQALLHMYMRMYIL